MHESFLLVLLTSPVYPSGPTSDISSAMKPSPVVSGNRNEHMASQYPAQTMIVIYIVLIDACSQVVSVNFYQDCAAVQTTAKLNDLKPQQCFLTHEPG